MCKTRFSKQTSPRQSAPTHPMFAGPLFRPNPIHPGELSVMSDKLANPAAKRATFEDYLTTERQGAGRAEYVSGRVVSKPGSNRWHNLLVSNIAIALGTR